MLRARCALAVLLSLPCAACGEEFVADTSGSSNPSCAGTSCPTGSCCQRSLIEGGEFPMGRSEDGTDQYSGELDELPEHPATVSSFRLDVLEVTVGRFRRFVEQYPDNAPKVGDGAHPRLPGSGWAVAWTNYLPADADELRAALSCDATLQTWTDEPGRRKIVR